MEDAPAEDIGVAELDSMSLYLEPAKVAIPRIFLARLTMLTHIGITLFCCIAFLGPEPVLWFHLAFVPLMLLHWRLNDDICILTDLELKLLGLTRDNAEPNRHFVRRLSSAFLKEPLSEVGADKLAKGIVWLAWGISAGRLAMIHYF